MTTRERILVVDDESEVREQLADVLGAEGFVVETAASGPAALERLTAFPADLVLTDYRMPGGMDGVELIRKIHESNPSKATLLMTGYLDAGVPGDGVTNCLVKPMEVDDLVWLIDYELACRPAVARQP